MGEGVWFACLEYYMMGVARLGEGVVGLFGYYMSGVARLGEGVVGLFGYYMMGVA